MKRLVLALCGLLPLLLASCAEDHGISLPAYKRELVKAIKKADRIEVIEHSDVYDMRIKSSQGDVISYEEPDKVPYFEYGRADLNDPAKQQFLAKVQAMDPGEPHGWVRCLFMPHHTLRFYKGDKVASTMRICFACSQVEWLGDLDARPDALLPILEEAVKSCGFSPDKKGSYWADEFEKTREARRKAGITHAPSHTGVEVPL